MTKFKWTVEIEVDETWVADGFNLDQDRADDWKNKLIAFAYDNEVSIKIIKSPSRKSIRKMQGYDCE